MRKPKATVLELGKQFRIRRRRLEMSETALTDDVRIGFQRIQWHEGGICDVSADELSGAADAFNGNVGDFTDRDDTAAGADIAGAARSIAPLTVRDAVELLECFHRMEEPLRNALLEIAKALSQPTPPTDVGRRP